jgi:hypothetical protein
MPTNTADIRQYLTSSYSDEELITLCADYFRDVYDNFAVGMTKTAKIQLLLDHCQRRDLMPNLLAALERDRPEQYRNRFGPAVVEPSPATAPPGRDPRQIFISHAHEDAEFAHRLAADLRARLAPLDRAGQHPTRGEVGGCDQSGTGGVRRVPGRADAFGRGIQVGDG